MRLDLGGVTVLARDTAGLRLGMASGGALDAVEAEGIRRAAAAASEAHLVLFVADAASTGACSTGSDSIVSLGAAVGAAAGAGACADGGIAGSALAQLLQGVEGARDRSTCDDEGDAGGDDDCAPLLPVLFVLNKCDVAGAAQDTAALFGPAFASSFGAIGVDGGGGGGGGGIGGSVSGCGHAGAALRRGVNVVGEARVSCRTGAGVEALLRAIEEKVRALAEGDDGLGEDSSSRGGISGRGSDGNGRSTTSARGLGAVAAEPALLTRERHRRHARGCLEALDAFLALVSPRRGDNDGDDDDDDDNDGHHEGDGGDGYRAGNPGCRRQRGWGAPVEVAAEELRIASRELGRVVGAVDVEEVLDVLFRDFCIGK